MRKFFTAALTTTAIAAGGLAVTVVNPLQGVSAQTAPKTTQSAAPTPTAPNGGPRGVLNRALNGLVTDKTLTQAQADAVRAAVEAEAKKGGGGGGGGHHLPGVLDRDKIAAAVSKALGITPKELKDGLKSGKSIADLATAKGLDVKKVQDALVTAGNSAIDQAVTAKKLTPARAAELKKRLPGFVEKIVNAKPGDHPFRGWRRAGRRPGS
ncbi:MAG: hypothetical protein JWM05_781 [Acidimicrobiales bacterium]|nr:hypothetical protein [Acidimicrobiales bacterium]